MDWNALKSKAIDFGKKAAEKAKLATEKTVTYTKDSLQKSSLTLKSLEDFEKIKAEKRLVILFLRESNLDSKTFLLKLPILMTQTWQASTTFRICDLDATNELGKHFEITQVPTLLIYKEGEKIEKKDSLKDINDAFSHLTSFFY